MKILLVLLVILFTGCCKYNIDGTGHVEFENIEYYNDPSPELRRNQPYKYITVNGYYYLRETEDFQSYIMRRYDYLYQKAILKGVNPDWYIDRYLNEGEANTRN
jgi:hypothetical protein